MSEQLELDTYVPFGSYEIPGVVELDERTGRMVMPLSAFPKEDQARYAEAAALPKPPPKWLVGETVSLPSRAYYEWYATRGIDYQKLRVAIPDWMRERVLERDGMVCGLCGGDIEKGDLHIDHIKPVSLGGATLPRNLQPAHARCNMSKGARV